MVSPVAALTPPASPEITKTPVVRRAHGGGEGDEGLGGRFKTAGNARNAKARDPVASRRTEERGFGHWNVRRSERRTTADNGDWFLWNVSG